MKQRLYYIDIAKGLLILLVVWHHIPYEAHNSAFSSFTSWIFKTQFCYVSFFMPAFFILTGYCAQFKQSFRPFLIKNTKTLLLPVIIFYFLNGVASFLLHRGEFCVAKEVIVFLKSGGAWFVPALFLAKLGYWMIVRFIADNRYVWITLFLLMGLGAVLYTKFNEYWYMWHAASLMIFLRIGEKIKELNLSKRHGIVTFIIYMGIVCCFVTFNVPIPRLSYSSMVNVYNMFPLLVMATSASISLIVFCKQLQRNKVLEYFGKNTLVVYLAHNTILATSITAMTHIYIPTSSIGYILLPIVVFTSTLFLCTLLVKLFNLRWMKWCLGKF